MSGPHVVVIGGGISGLAAAHRLAGSRDVRVTLLEAGPRLGGKVRTESFGGVPLDLGPDALLTRVPGGLALCEELGLDGELVTPAIGDAMLWTRGRLRPLPPRMLDGAPGGVLSVVRTRTLSARGLARAALDLLLPAHAPADDVPIGAIVRARLGAEALERLVDPLLGGIHAGSCDELSAEALAPQLLAAARGHRSLVRGLRAAAADRPPDATPAGSPFASLPGGLGRLVEALADALGDTDVRTTAPVSSLAALAGGGVRVVLDDDEAIDADAAVLAVPAHAAAPLLQARAPAAAASLRSVRHASVAVVAMRFTADDVPATLPAASGFLVPRVDGHLMTACTLSSRKWSHLDAGGDLIVKCSAGRAGDHRAFELDDDALAARLHAELGEALGIAAAPVETRVARFSRALPQYAPGHKGRVAAVEAAVAAALPGVRLAGAAHHGAGLSSCIASGRRAADAALRTAGADRAPVET